MPDQDLTICIASDSGHAGSNVAARLVSEDEDPLWPWPSGMFADLEMMRPSTQHQKQETPP